MKEDKVKTNYQQIVVKTNDGELFTGNLNIYALKRLSDKFQSDEPFIVLIDAKRKSYDDTSNIVFINKANIAWAIPQEKKLRNNI